MNLDSALNWALTGIVVFFLIGVAGYLALDDVLVPVFARSFGRVPPG